MTAHLLSRPAAGGVGMLPRSAWRGWPWYSGFLLGEVVFALLKWILPALCADDPALCHQAGAIAGLAWFFAGACMLLGLGASWQRCRGHLLRLRLR